MMGNGLAQCSSGWVTWQKSDAQLEQIDMPELLFRFKISIVFIFAMKMHVQKTSCTGAVNNSKRNSNDDNNNSRNRNSNSTNSSNTDNNKYKPHTNSNSSNLSQHTPAVFIDLLMPETVAETVNCMSVLSMCTPEAQLWK